jgi:hypothetical protein
MLTSDSYEDLSTHNPEHDPHETYYIFRGLSGPANSDYLGLSWSTNPYLAYQPTKNQGQESGPLYVATVGMEEILRKEQYLTVNFQRDEIKNILANDAMVELRLNENPNNARVVTAEELQALFSDTPPEGLYASWNTKSGDIYRDQVNWRNRSESIFGGRL